MKFRFAIFTLALSLGACTATASKLERASAVDSGHPDLTCQISSNCVSSRGENGMKPLAFSGTAAQGLGILRDTLVTFSEATVVNTEPLAMTVIFTTTLGFRDQVDFKVDVQRQRVDFRSRSLFGLYDWGKNRSRMEEFTRRFEEKSRSR